MPLFVSSPLLRFLCEELFQISVLKVGNSATQLCFNQKNASLRSISTFSIKNHSFTVSYLVKSCGLAREAAIAASKSIQLQTSHKPDSVLSLFTNHGFTKTHISKLISRRPLFLLSDPEKTLKPKIEFFHSLGISKPDLAKMICRAPTILTRSLEHQIIPSTDFLRSLLHTDENVAAVLKRTAWVIRPNLQQELEPNIAQLRAHGLSESKISTLLMYQPRSLLQNHDRFNEILGKIKGMGFDSQSYLFLQAIPVMTGMTKSTWERKVEIYRRWGWSEVEILSAFRKEPSCMNKSEKKIMEVMDFLVNTIGCDSTEIAKYPFVFKYSLESRIIPRGLVIQVLLSKGLIQKDFKISTLLIPGEKNFLKLYVTKYKVEVPQLLEFYHGKIDLLGLRIGSKEMCRVKKC